MSGNVEDEARARLDVARFYEDMGQLPKAVRYYLEAFKSTKRPVSGLATGSCATRFCVSTRATLAEAELNEADPAAEKGAPAAAPAAPANAAPAAAPVKAPPRPQTGNQLPPLQLPPATAG